MMHRMNERIVRSITTIFVIVLISLFVVGVVQAVGGELIWTDELHIAGGSSSVMVVAVDGGRVFAAGFASPNNGDLLVRAYDGKTGALLWQDQYDRANQPDNALAIAAAMGKVFVAGLAADASGEADFLVRAYDGKTGALLWQDQYDAAGGWDVAASIVVHGGRVFAAGQAMMPGGNSDFLVRAYDAKSGQLLWHDRVDKAGGSNAFDIANAITVEGSRVFAVGYVTNAAGNYDFYVRGYDAKSGAVLWENQRDKGGSGGDRGLTITAANGRIFAAGDTSDSLGNTDILVRTFNAESGLLIWETYYDHAGFFDWAISIVEYGGRVFVAGQVREFAFVPDFFVQAYDAATGEILWQDQHDIAGSTDDARAITAAGGFVFAAGGGWNAAGNTDFLVRAYDAVTGALQWQDQLDRGAGNDYAHAIMAKGGHVFAAGFDQEAGTGFPGTHSDFVARAYDAE